MASKPKKTRRVNGKLRGNKHIPVELTLARETRAWDLKARGYPVTEIHRLLVEEFHAPITRRAVHMALARVADRVSIEAVVHVAAYKGRQIESLKALYEESMAAWRRSVGPQVETSERVETAPAPTPDPAGTPAAAPADAAATPLAAAPSPPAPPAPVVTRHVMNTKKHSQAGDPRFLTAALEALRDLRKMLGLDAPLKVDVSQTERDLPPDVLDLRIQQLQREIAAAEVRRAPIPTPTAVH